MSRIVGEGVLESGRCLLIDPADAPFAQWNRRAANCTMPFLRSPASHGIDPDFRAVRRSAPADGDDHFTAPYHRPSAALFERHLADRAHRTLGGVSFLRGRVTDIRPSAAARFRLLVEPAIDTDRAGEALDYRPVRIDARVVILAPGQPEPLRPTPFDTLPSTAPVYHVHDRDFDPAALRSGMRVALVGGGIAAAHLAVSLTARGVGCEIWNRDRMTSWQFDSDPCFIGPRCAALFAAIEDYGHRRELIRRSRRPGSLPPDLFEQLAHLVAHRRVLVRRAEVESARASGRTVSLAGRAPASIPRQAIPRQAIPRQAILRKTPPHRAEYDATVLCTGFSSRPPMEETIRAIAGRWDVPVTDDTYPILRRDLSWTPGLYVTGALAELELGPPARNLIGAHLAGRRIVPSVRRDVS